MTKLQTGARWIRRERELNRDKDVPMLHSIRTESKLIRLKSGAVKRCRP